MRSQLNLKVWMLGQWARKESAVASSTVHTNVSFRNGKRGVSRSHTPCTRAFSTTRFGRATPISVMSGREGTFHVKESQQRTNSEKGKGETESQKKR